MSIINHQEKKMYYLMSFVVIDPKFFFTMIDNDASYHMM